VYPPLPPLFNVTVLRAVTVVVPTFPLSSVTVRSSVTVAVPPGILLTIVVGYGTATLIVLVLVTVRYKVVSIHWVETLVLQAVVVSSFVMVAQSVMVKVRAGSCAVVVEKTVWVR
jgi:hypothetical protein